MPLKDKLILGPIDKYQIHGRFPWKMILCIMIVTFSTAQVQIMVKNSSDQNRVESLNFYRMFVNADVWILLILTWCRRITTMMDFKDQRTFIISMKWLISCRRLLKDTTTFLILNYHTICSKTMNSCNKYLLNSNIAKIRLSLNL